MEEDILNGNNGMIFDAPMEEASYIKVIGVGGGGGNAVNHMYRQGIKGVDFIVCNTDKKSLDQSPVPTKIQLGPGLGAGNNPEKAKKYACEKAEDKRNNIQKYQDAVYCSRYGWWHRHRSSTCCSRNSQTSNYR